MATRMMRVSEDTHSLLKDLARERHESLQSVLSRAVSEFRERHFFDELDEAYQRLAGTNSMPEYRQELAALDGTLGDGLEEEPRAPAPTRRN
jgi:hypothetical protein